MTHDPIHSRSGVLTPVEFIAYTGKKPKKVAARVGVVSVKPKPKNLIQVDDTISGSVMRVDAKTVLDKDVGVAIHIHVGSSFPWKDGWHYFGRDW